MFKPLLLVGTLIGMLSSMSHPDGLTQAASWVPQVGDTFSVDTEKNTGTLMHTNGRKLTFPVITGQQRMVSYIGLRYYAATPKRQWIAKTIHTQPDRITYGKEGTFLRLYGEDGEYTHYGIHAHAEEDVMFARENRHQSMGCIIVRKEILDLIEETWRKNGGEMNVVTY